ncbi:MAG TPA: hypothetical protein VLM80_03855 [Anaerolineales bacterium]|nr:hypothetical protein [Anaerolineales bacterium]
MKKRAIVLNLFVAMTLLLMAFIVPSSFGAYAQPENPDTPEAIDAMPPPILEFPGIFREFPVDWSTDPDAVIPDTSGAAGHTHFLQAANKTVALFRKDGEQVAFDSFDNFWAGATTGTVCDGGQATHHGQPYVMYDHMASRWVVVDVAYADVDNGPYFLCLAVSNGVPAPVAPGVYFDAAHWKYMAINTAEGQMNLYPSSPKLGLWPDGYYLSADMLDVYNNGKDDDPEGVKVWALNREDLTSPSTTVIRYIDFYLPEWQNYEHLVPSNLLGYPPPTGTPNYFAAIQQGKFHIWEFYANWLNPSSSTFGTATNEPNKTIVTDTSASWASGYVIPQPAALGTIPEQLDVVGDRLMSPLQYRNTDNTPSLWATHALHSGGVVGMRWYEMQFGTDGLPYFSQIGTHQPDTNYRWLGSLAVDRVGNMALGFSISSSTLNPSIYYAGRLKSDAAGVLAQGENILYPRPVGAVFTGPQLDNDAVFDGPWGRQSQMSVDPLDECVFWYTNMYYDPLEIGQVETPLWRTRIGWFSFPECRGGALNRVSLHTNNAQGDKASGVPFEMYSTAISADGRYVAFSSEATTLVDGDTNNKRDIFVRDRDFDADGVFDEPGAVKTERVSLGLAGLQSNGDSWEVSISSDGRYVAFSSDASNLVDSDINGARDVFVFDRVDRDTVRASVVDGTANTSGNGFSDQPFIAGGGRYVAFRSAAANLVIGDLPNIHDIFVRDLSLNRTYLISSDTADPNVPGDGNSLTPSISSNGRYVAFASQATNLLGAGVDTNGFQDIYVKDWMSDIIARVSVQDATGVEADGDSSTPWISTTGFYVAFASRATNLVAPIVDDNNYQDIFVTDLNVAAPYPVSRISVNFFGDQALNGNSYSPSITADGKFIAFASEASNLDVFLPDVNGYRDIFLHDRTLAASGVYDVGMTQRISLDYSRTEPNDWSFAPAIASNGRHVAFVSEATDLVTNDTNNAWDVFAYDNQRMLPVFLRIPGNIPGAPGEIVTVPILFDDNGMGIDTTTFSVDFDEVCLEFDPAIPNAVEFFVPPAFTAYYSFSPTDKDGELDFSIYDQVAPRAVLPDSTLATIKFRVRATCQAIPGTTTSARVGFSADPPPSFGSYGQSVRGISIDGFISIIDGILGDCNGDGHVDAGDLSALVLEIFDGDDVLPANTPGGTFPGNPVGCNPNQDMVVDAGDISCTVLIIWGGGSASCTGLPTSFTNLSSMMLAAQADQVEVVLPDAVQALKDGTVNIPISFNPATSLVNSMIFSIDIDESWLGFEDTDADKDGLPDAVSFTLPDGFIGFVSYNADDSDGELDVAVYNLTGSGALPAGTFMNLSLTTGSPSGTFLAVVQSSADPVESFGSTTGLSLLGVVQDGSVSIADTLRTFLPMLVK